MADLRELFADLGYGDISTLLNSGNVAFTAPREAATRTEARIEQAIFKRFGFPARVTVLASAELTAAITENPLCEIAGDASRFLVTVLKRPEDRALLAPLGQLDWAPEALAIGARVAYLWCPDGILASRLAAAVGRVLGDAATTRNWATMKKLHGLVESQL